MTEATKTLSVEARKLSPAERIDLVDDILASLDEPDPRIVRVRREPRIEVDPRGVGAQDRPAELDELEQLPGRLVTNDGPNHLHGGRRSAGKARDR